MKKRIVILLLVFALILSTTACAVAERVEEAAEEAVEGVGNEAIEESDDTDSSLIPYKTLLTDAVIDTYTDGSAEGLMSNSLGRALLTYALVIDLYTATDERVNVDILSPSYIGIHDLLVYVIGDTEEEMVIITYAPLLKRGSYAVYQVQLPSSDMQYLISQMCGASNTYENDTGDLVSIAVELGKILDN